MRLSALAAGAALLLAAVAPACAQGVDGGRPTAPVAAPVLVVDMDRAVRDSAAAGALRRLEVEDRRALAARFDALKAELEAEEAELVGLRDTLDKAAFDARVIAFDRKVRGIRRAAQEDAAALQARYAAAQRALLDMARPIAEALMRERGAGLILDRKAALAVEPAQDVTDALVARLDAAVAEPEALLPPEPPSAPARTGQTP